MAEFSWNAIYEPFLAPLNGGTGRALSGMSGTNVPTHPGGTVEKYDPNAQYGLVDVPGTNFVYNPATGQYQMKNGVPRGANPVVDSPTLAQQSAAASAIQQMYLNQYGDAMNRIGATRADQNNLRDDYLGVIAGRSPSVAATQLTTGMGRIGQDQNSMAAGANGQNAFAARRVAAQNIARAQGDLSGQLALTRAAETNAARTGLASLYGTEAQADVAAGNIAAGTGLGYAKVGEEAESDRVGADQRADEANAAANEKSMNKFGQGLAFLFG